MDHQRRDRIPESYLRIADFDSDRSSLIFTLAMSPEEMDTDDELRLELN